MTLPKLARQVHGVFAHIDATAAARSSHSRGCGCVCAVCANMSLAPPYLCQPTAQALLPALTHHAKLAVLDVSGCCLSDAGGIRAASLLRAQAAAAAQEAWACTLRGSSSSRRRRPSSSGSCQDSCRLLRRAEAGWQGGASVQDCSDRPKAYKAFFVVQAFTVVLLRLDTNLPEQHQPPSTTSYTLLLQGHQQPQQQPLLRAAHWRRSRCSVLTGQDCRSWTSPTTRSVGDRMWPT